MARRPIRTVPLSFRDRALLRAVASGRCRLSDGFLLVDGLCCADQFAADRLVRAGLIVPGDADSAALSTSGNERLTLAA